MRVSSCDKTSLAFYYNKAGFVQSDCTGKFHNGDVQVHNKTCYLRKFLSLLRRLTYLERFSLKMGTYTVFVFERTFSYGYVELKAGQELTQLARQHLEFKGACLQRDVVRDIHNFQLRRNTCSMEPRNNI